VFWIRTKAPNSPKPEDEEKKEKRKPRIKLRDGKIDSTHDVYLFLSADGKPISVRRVSK
jgi:hypothetical protein